MLKYFREKSGQKGFTLIELMIVVAIIGILAAIAIPQFTSYRKKSYNTAAKAELKSYYTACQAYLTDHPTMATNCALADLATSFVPTTTITPAGDTSCSGTTAYHSGGDSTYTIGASGNITP